MDRKISPLKKFVDFMRAPAEPGRRATLGIIVAAAAAIACVDGEKAVEFFTPIPGSENQRPVELSSNETYAPWAEFLALATHYNPTFYKGFVNPKQADITATFFIENQIRSEKGIVALRNLAISEGKCIAAAGCIDTRLFLPDIFPNVENIGADVTQLLEQDNLFYSTPVYKIGAQPSIFQQGINQSFFVTHQTAIGALPAECIREGCGLFAGIDTILRDPIGIEILKQHHGVSEATIEEMQRLIAMGNNADPAEWAKAGARMQAEMNFVAHGGQEVQYAAWGTAGHANDGFIASTEVIDNFGNIHKIDDFPMLKAYADYMNQPHPIIEEFARDQAPAIIHMNGSRVFTAEDISGNLIKEKGIVMPSEVDKIPGRPPVSWEEAKRAFAGADYGIGVLQNDKVLIVTADNAVDLETLINFVKTEGIKTGSIRKFLGDGGVIVGMLPDQTGKIEIATLINNENIGAEIMKLDIVKKGYFDTLSREGFIELIKANKLGRLLSESQLLRLAKYYQIARPFLPFLKLGADALGTYFSILDLANFVESGVGHDLVYNATPTNADTIISGDYHRLLDPDEYQRLTNEWGGANPYVTSGLVKGMRISQGAMSDEYLKGWFAYNTFLDRIAKDPSFDPSKFTPIEKAFSDMESANDLGQVIVLNIPIEFPNELNEYIRPSIKLQTSLVVKPGLNDTGEYVSLQPKDFNDVNQSMMLVDEMTGQFTSLASGDGPMQFLGVDETGFQYLMEAVPSPETKSFEIRFVAPLGYLNETSFKNRRGLASILNLYMNEFLSNVKKELKT